VFEFLKRYFSSGDDNSDENKPSASGALSGQTADAPDADRTGKEKEMVNPEEEVLSASEAGAHGSDAGAGQLQRSASDPQLEQTLPSATLVGKSRLPEKEQRLQMVQRSHIGAVRKRNEDASFTFVSESGGHESLPPFGLFIVADGMGGHYDGHRASQIVSRTLAAHVLDRLYLPLLQGEEGGNRPPVQEVMENGVRLANKALFNPEREDAMGTTLTAALVFGSRLFLVHVGDSRAYLLAKDGELQPVTTDHSVVQALRDAGQITAEEAAVHPDRNLLYRALMGETLEQIDTYTQSLPKEGTLILCSDGLWGLVPDERLQQTLGEELSLSEKADRLVDQALEAGGHDNITVILVDFQL
jgi:serine/threonine protein phosphatase PrpC